MPSKVHRGCACCDAPADQCEEHHLYLKADGCPDHLTVWLCSSCHGATHQYKARVNISRTMKQKWADPTYQERHRIAMVNRGRNSSWKKNHKAAMEKLTKDPAWRAAHLDRLERVNAAGMNKRRTK